VLTRAALSNARALISADAAMGEGPSLHALGV
jgi:hypothetical protein